MSNRRHHPCFAPSCFSNLTFTAEAAKAACPARGVSWGHTRTRRTGAMLAKCADLLYRRSDTCFGCRVCGANAPSRHRGLGTTADPGSPIQHGRSGCLCDDLHAASDDILCLVTRQRRWKLVLEDQEHIIPMVRIRHAACMRAIVSSVDHTAWARNR